MSKGVVIGGAIAERLSFEGRQVTLFERPAWAAAPGRDFVFSIPLRCKEGGLGSLS